MSEQQLSFAIEPAVCCGAPLLIQEVGAAEHLYQELRAMLDKGLADVWGYDAFEDDVLEVVELALAGENWRPGNYRSAAQRVLRAVSRNDYYLSQKAMGREFARLLDELASATDHLRARVEFEYLRSFAA